MLLYMAQNGNLVIVACLNRIPVKHLVMMCLLTLVLDNLSLERILHVQVPGKFADFHLHAGMLVKQRCHANGQRHQVDKPSGDGVRLRALRSLRK